MRDQGILTHMQILTDEAGTEAATAYKAWMKRVKPLLCEAAAAVLWPAPHLPPRNRSHGLLLYVTCDKSTTPPRFKVEPFEEVTLEEMSARTARALSGEDFLWPEPDDFPPGSMAMRATVFCSNLGRQLVLRGLPSFFTGALVAGIKDGKIKMPTAEEAFERIRMVS